MIPETRRCENCRQDFHITDEDCVFYEKMRVPAPGWCPDCRLVRRMVWRNERALYKRPCDMCKAKKIMMFPRESPYAVYCVECWWSDKWDASSFGRDYDFSCPFFAQFKELYLEVPRPGVIQQTNVRSEYTNRTSMNKDCYLIYGSNKNENCMYGTQVNDSRESLDCFDLQESELCYECVDCFKCYRLQYSKECMSCADSYFLLDCRNCQNCFGCTNLRNKNYCIFNEQFTKEEYEKTLASWNLGSFMMRQSFVAKYKDLALAALYPYMVARQHTNATGNWLENVRDVKNAYGCRSVENGQNLFAVIEAKDVMDYTYWGRNCELVYDTISVGMQCSNIKFCNELWNGVAGAEYSMNCPSSSNIFGCVGLRKKEYSILNKQYSAGEFKELVEKIKLQMNSHIYTDHAGRKYPYGEFFPPELSPFAYNETIAQEYFPLSEEEATSKGFVFKKPEQKNYAVTLSGLRIPDDLKSVDENILKETIQCEHKGACNDQCATAFRITPPELEFYKKLNIPLPHLCPNCRHFARLRARNPLHLSHRCCDCPDGTAPSRYKNTTKHTHGEIQCPNEFETSYASDRPELVYCESCFLSEVQ